MAIYEELEELLNENSKWLEQVKMSLSITGQLYASFKAIENAYENNLLKCEEQAKKSLNTYEEFKAQKREFEEFLKLASTKANELKEHMEGLKDRVEDLHEESSYFKHEMDVYFTEIEKFRIQTLELKELLKDKEEEARRALRNFEILLLESKEELNEILENARNVKELAVRLKEELNENHEEFMEFKQVALSEFQNEKTQALNTLENTKNTSLNELNTGKILALKALEDTKNQNLEEFVSLSNASKSQIQNLVNEAKKPFDFIQEGEPLNLLLIEDENGNMIFKQGS